MRFRVLSNSSRVPSKGRDVAYLSTDNWDDWGKYRTMFGLSVFDKNGVRHDAGSVKIGQKGLKPGFGSQAQPGLVRTPLLAEEFETLSQEHFSLGQNDNYYEVIGQLPDGLGEQVLRALRDCALDPNLLDAMQDEEVMSESLLRSVHYQNVRNRFHQLAMGNAALTEFHFRYTLASGDAQTSPPVFEFRVDPNSMPPTNVHVLIGRNGVGKTRCFQLLATALLVEATDPVNIGVIEPLGENREKWAFSGLVAVTFSSFDTFRMPAVTRPQMNAALVGIRNEMAVSALGVVTGRNGAGGPAQHTASTTGNANDRSSFADVFCDSLEKCRTGPRKERYRDAIRTLEADPMFKEANVGSLVEQPDDAWREVARAFFGDLSTGHAVVLLTITRLVELVDERTVVLMDEPEAHLHPPLLSALVRALSDLLKKRNGLAIIATHSPVVLQEVPRSCVWILGRSGHEACADQPTLETFGESLGALTREVFQHEATYTGFHRMLSEAVANPQLDYDAVLSRFNGQLGAEARAMLRALIAVRDRQQDEDRNDARGLTGGGQAT